MPTTSKRREHFFFSIDAFFLHRFDNFSSRQSDIIKGATHDFDFIDARVIRPTASFPDFGVEPTDGRSHGAVQLTSFRF